jgi:AcrR family transcriptional regulator
MSELLEKDEVIVQEIVSCARVLFEKFGLKKTTMEDIAKEAGKGKSSLYYYFESKYEIFEAVVDQEMQELFNVAENEVKKSTTAKEKLKAYSKVRLGKINKLGNLSQVVKNDLMDNMSVVMNIKKKHEITQFNLIKNIIESGINSGEFKKICCQEVELLAFLFAATFRGIALPMCVDSMFPDLTEKVDDIVDIMIDGIAN